MKFLKKLFIPLCLAVSMMVIGASACDALDPIEESSSSQSTSVADPITYTLNLTANKTTALRGEEVTLSVYKCAEGEEDVLVEEGATYQIEEGKNYATLSGNKLTVSESAPANAVIKVQAKVGVGKSNVVEIKVNVPLESVSVSADDVTNVLSGASVTLAKTVTPNGADTTALVWTVTEGAEYCTITGDVLVVKSTAPTGASIKVKAVSGDIESNVLSFTVGYPLESLIVAQPATTNILSGNSVALSVNKKPVNTTETYSWVVVEGSEYATVTNDTLTVSANAPTGATLKLKAVCGDIESNEVSFVVGYPLTALRVTVNGSTNVAAGAKIDLSVTKTPENTTNGDYEWVIVEGGDYAYVENGKLIISEDTPFDTDISVKAVGAVESNVVSFVIGIPIEEITISSDAPQILTHGGKYNVSLSAKPEGASTKAVQWEASEEGWATFANGQFTVSENVPHGATLKIKAVSGDVESNELSFQVGIALESLTATMAGKTNVDPGASRMLSVTRAPENTTDTKYTWTFEEGEDYCSIVNNVLTVDDDAPIGAKIVFKAVNGSVESEPIEVTVGVPVTAINISINGKTNVNIDPDDSKLIDVVFAPDNASAQKVTWEFTQGEEHCTISASNNLIIKENVAIGTQISFKAVIGEVSSNDIYVTVGTPITGLTISANTTEIKQGEEAKLSVAVTPNNASAAYTWVLADGDGDDYAYAYVEDRILYVSKDAPTGSVIKVKAVSGSVESNVLSFTVKEATYYLSFNNDTPTVDKNGNTSTSLNVTLRDADFVSVTDKKIYFTVVEGEEFLTLTQDGYSCLFTPKGHGTAYVEVTVEGLNISKQAVVTVILPPETITLPGVFAEKANYAYNFSMNDHDSSTGAQAGKDALPFVATASSSNNLLPCLDVVYTFRHADGSTGDAVATYSDGKITFHKTGLVTVTVSSNSGSRIETTVSYTFNINDGYNVYTFEEAAYLLDLKAYTGQIVNFVVLDRVVGDDGYDYGYSFVPEAAKKVYPKLEDYADNAAYIEAMLPYYESIINPSTNRIIAVSKNLHINGNNHTIDASHLPVPSDSLIEAGNTKFGKKWPHHGGLISAEPWTSADDPTVQDVYGDFYVKIYDLEVIGNTDINYANNENPGVFGGGYMTGINVGTQGYSAKYYVDIKNVTASAFKEGFKMNKVVEGTLENAYAYNCWQNGFGFRASIIKVKDLKLGACGAVGIELQPEDSNKAGVNGNQPATVTFEGKFDVTGNTHTMNTSYLNHYKINLGAQSVDVPTIVNASILLSGLTENQVAHLRNAGQELCLITFIMMGTVANSSQALYPSYQEGGIIAAEDLPKDGVDTEHQFIRLTVYAAQGVSIGSALLYNLNYGK